MRLNAGHNTTIAKPRKFVNNTEICISNCVFNIFISTINFEYLKCFHNVFLHLKLDAHFCAIHHNLQAKAFV